MKFKGGWHGESYRHYLARHGVKTVGMKTRGYRADQLTFTKSVLAQIEKTRAEKDAEERRRLQAREQSVFASTLPYADRPLTATELDEVRQKVNWMKLSEKDRKEQLEGALYGEKGVQGDLMRYQILLNSNLARDDAGKLMVDLDGSIAALSAAQRFGMTPEEYGKSRALMNQLALVRNKWVQKYPELEKQVNAQRDVELSGPDPYGVAKLQERMKKIGEATKSGATKAWEKTKEIGSKAKALEEKGVAWVKEEYPVAKEYAKEKLQEFKDKQIEADFKREDMERQLMGASAFKNDRSIKKKGDVLEVTPEGVISKPGDLMPRAFEPYGEPKAPAFKNEGVLFENEFIKIAKPVSKPGFVAPTLAPERQPKLGRVAPAKVPIWEEGWKGGEE